MRKFFMPLVMAASLVFAVSALADDAAKEATLYKNPECGCCEAYADYLRDNGFKVTVKPTHDMTLIKRQQSVPPALEGCHTTLVQGYVVEGHVPIGVLDKLLAERPKIRGISLPGMPLGSPGMSGPKQEPFKIYEIGDGPARIYAVE